MATVIDPWTRVDRLISQQEPRFAQGFRRMVGQMRRDISLAQIEVLLEQGRLEDAMELVLRRVPELPRLYNESFMSAAQETAQFFNRNLSQVFMVFDQTNTQAVHSMQENQVRLIREFSQTQRDATRTALLDGIQAGDNPRAQARNFRDSIGLTAKQQRAVANYRRALESGSSDALRRKLRDRRYDRSVIRSMQTGDALDPALIDRMVDRYRERYIKYRSEVIARTEALKSVHEGRNASYQQAIADGHIDPNSLRNEWQATLDDRTRDTHSELDQRTVPYGGLFTTIRGNSAPYPGAFGVAEEDIQCRCRMGTRIVQIAPIPGITAHI